MKTITIALTGNPNAGKSTVFNALTGENQHIGNWPGKTVERKEGTYVHKDVQVKVIDLPGVYSLSSFSPEEEVTRDYLVKESYDLIVNVLDTSNLERNLYLTVQIKEIGAPTVILLNKSDMAQMKGYQINTKNLSNQLGGIPILQATAKNGEGLAELKDLILQHTSSQKAPDNEIRP